MPTLFRKQSVIQWVTEVMMEIDADFQSEESIKFQLSEERDPAIIARRKVPWNGFRHPVSRGWLSILTKQKR